jgi:hypothetical protein
MPGDSDRSRKKGTLLPILQISELFAFSGAEVEGGGLSLLSEYGIPLHVFQNGRRVRTDLPAEGILAGGVVVEQVRALQYREQSEKLVREILRGAIRLRVSAAARICPGQKEHWEGVYLDLLSRAYLGNTEERLDVCRRIRALDEERRRNYSWNWDGVLLARDLGEAIVLGSFARLSLDPWFSPLEIPDSALPPLAASLAFLLEPLFVDSWSGGPPKPDDPGLCSRFKRHLTRGMARDGKRVWSLRSLALREGYGITAHIMGKGRYRAVVRTEVPDDDDD